MLRALLYAYVIGGLTFIPLLIGIVIFITIYTSVPVGDADVTKSTRARLETTNVEGEKDSPEPTPGDINDTPRTRKGWLTMRRTFEETVGDSGYVTMVRSFLDSRSKDPKKSRPKDMWYVVLKGNVLYLYEDEDMSDCEAAVELSGHQVVIYPEDLPDGELFARRNAICLKPKASQSSGMPSVTKQMVLEKENIEEKLESSSATGKKQESQKEKEDLVEIEKAKDEARKEALDPSSPWFIFVRSNIEMEDWYFSLIHASEHPAQTPTLSPLSAIFDVSDMNHLVATLDEQPDVIPMRWLNGLLGRIFFSHYRTHNLEAYIIGRLMKKLSKVKRPAFLTEISVTQVSVGNKAPMLSKPMLKELTKEGDASIEVHLQYKGEVRITVEATAVINLGARFKSYTVKLELAAVLKELEGNLLIKVKRPPSNRIWYAFTQTPRMVLEVEPIVSDRQITWGMILSTIESKFKEIIQDSVVMPNMDDIAFFETAPYEHRGGIWSDAGRKSHVCPIIHPSTEGDSQSTASAPLLDAASVSAESAPSTPPPKDTEESITDPLERSSSAPAEVPSISTDLVEDITDSTPKNAKRHNKEESISNDTRGRTLDSERLSSPRSQSTPKPESVRSVTPERPTTSGADASSSKKDRSGHNSRRSSSSQFSFKVDHHGDDNEPPVETKSTPATPRKNSDASSQIGRSPSPPSFFSTLKSKAAAADKQAISNSAKEALRKWGANWGGFKKDATTSSDDGSQLGTSPPRSNLIPDSASSFAQKAKASYAEVRAAVAERKERERTHQQQDEHSDNSNSGAANPTPRARVASGSNSGLPVGSVYSEATINPSIITSAARLSTPRLTTKKSTPSLSRVETEVDTHDLPETSEPVKQHHAPIHVQPVAKTMSIPGIHASHRGEVQSMGHVASPQPSPPPPAPTETLLKNPAIQTVYRLWKTPSNQGQGYEVVDQRNQPELQNTGTGDLGSGAVLKAGSEAHDETSASLTQPSAGSLAQSTVKPAPPPLPPRSSVLRSATIVPPDTTTTASQSLKEIAEKDSTKRSSLPINEPPTITAPETASASASASTASTSTSVTRTSPEPSVAFASEAEVTNTGLDLDPDAEDSSLPPAPSSSVTVNPESISDLHPPSSPPALPPRRTQLPAQA